MSKHRAELIAENLRSSEAILRLELLGLEKQENALSNCQNNRGQMPFGQTDSQIKSKIKRYHSKITAIKKELKLKHKELDQLSYEEREHEKYLAEMRIKELELKLELKTKV